MADSIGASQSPFGSLLNPGLVAEARRIELRTKRSVNAETAGRFRSVFRGSGLTFAELREYQAGDEIRRIDWKASVRTGRTYVKSYQEERTLTIVLAIDCSRSTAFGAPRSKHRKALEFAALVTILARQSGDAVGLLRFSDDVDDFLPPARKRSQAQRILCSLIEERDLKAATDLRPALRRLQTTLRKRSIVFVVSDFFSPIFTDELSFLSAKHDVICVHLSDPPGGLIPNCGIVEVTDAESGEQLLIDSGSKTGKNAIEALQRRRVQELRESCSRARADFIELFDHPLRPLTELMNRRARRFR